MNDNTVKMDSDSTDFRLLQTSLSVQTLETVLDATDRLRSRPLPACLHSCNGRLADRTAIVASCYVVTLDTSHRPLARSIGIVAKDPGNSLQFPGVIAPSFMWLSHSCH